MKKKRVRFDDNKLQERVEQLSLQYFGLPFNHLAFYNYRLRTTGGRYLLDSHNIEINPKQYEYFGEDVLVGIIKHELCHYHLHLQGKGFKHQDRDFIYLMEKVGAPRYCDQIPGTENRESFKHLYECVGCKLRYKRKRKIDVKKYVCGKCKGKLKKLK